MWPRDAYVGQRVVGLISSDEGLEKGRVYVIVKVAVFFDTVYLVLDKLTHLYTRYDALKPVDESRLDVFREMLKNVPNRKDVVRPETV